jgi:serine/threonine-protein kinase
LKEHLDLGRWPEADDLLDRALALPPEEREAFVRRATAHDRALGYALASIVREAARDDGFLEPGGALTGDFGEEVNRALDFQPGAHILTPGNSLEHYEVVELLGRGGMGEVYRARDRRINRDVALKVLLPQFSADPDRLARFRREAQVLAAINHPGIASIYGLAEQDNVRALVLEYVDGMTLAERIESGPLSVIESVAIARQLAEAIEAAHEAGIIHRDLKPANIILLRTPGDRVNQGYVPALKVLDFGLGKALAPLPHDTALHGLTGTSPGILLGTAAYMSPEQARADVVDERADIWAFGCVLFEMLTGTRAFPGRTAAEVLGNIVEREPAFSLLPVDTPASIRRLLRRSLEKRLDRRLSCVRDAILELDDATLPALEPAARRPPSIAAFVTAIAAIGIVAALVLQTVRRPAPVPEPVTRFAVALPPGDTPAVGLQPLVTLSPDGRTLVYAAQRGDASALFRRDLAALEPVPIAGTDGASAPFFSPDGRWLGFVANGELKRIPLAGGAVETIAPAAGDVTAAWTADDAIVFSTTATRVLHRVPASGGTPAALTALNLSRGDRIHLLPQPLPGNTALLYTIVTASERQVAVLRRDSGQTTILTTGTHARYLQDGHLIFSRDSSVLIAPFDAERLVLTGEPMPLLEGVEHTADQAMHLDVAADGSMVYLPAGDYDAAVRRIAWFDRSGRQSPVGLEARPYVGAAIAPDGSRIALAIREQGNADIWVASPSRQTMTQLTADATNETLPVWSPDGQSILFQSDRAGADIYRRDAQGAGQVTRLTPQQSSPLQGPHSLTPDGRVLLFGLRSGIAAVTPPSTDVQALVTGTAAMLDPRVSSDGRYLAYQSNESGQFEIYVSDYPPRGTRRWRVSPAGGTLPRWARGGHELFFVDDAGLMTVPMAADPAQALVGATRVWAMPAAAGEHVIDYDVAPDGVRFLVIVEKRSPSGAPKLIVVRNWLEELRTRFKPSR